MLLNVPLDMFYNRNTVGPLYIYYISNDAQPKKVWT